MRKCGDFTCREASIAPLSELELCGRLLVKALTIVYELDLHYLCHFILCLQGGA